MTLMEIYMQQSKFEPKIVKAKYIEHLDEDLNDNPLTESIHIIMDYDEIRERLVEQPPIQENFWDLPGFYKKTQLNALTRYHVANDYCPFLYHKFCELMLCHYQYRDPFSVEQVRLKTMLSEYAREKTYLLPTVRLAGVTTAPSSLLHGPSGSGKSTTLRNSLSLIPQVIIHESFKGKPYKSRQITWLSFDCPATASPKALALSFFTAIDSALSKTDNPSRYAKEWEGRERVGVEHLYGMMQSLAARYNIGLVHIDELQFFLSYIKSPKSPNLQIIESLFNKIGIPVFLSSTTEGLTLFDPVETESGQIPDFTIVRRLIDDREYELKPLKYGTKNFNDTFDLFFRPEICIDGKVPTEEFKTQFHYLTAGLQSAIARLARLHHETVIMLNNKCDVGKPKISTGDISVLISVYQKQFHRMDYALSFLREGNVIEFDKQCPKTDEGKINYDSKSEKDNSSNKPITKVSKKAPGISGSGKVSNKRSKPSRSIKTGFGENDE
jgi:hypothetical protein